MSITNGYVTLADIKVELEITNTDSDEYLEKIIEGTSRWIDAYTNRRFYAATETRYYSTEWSDLVFLDDLLSVTTLKTDNGGDRSYDDSWSTTDYDLLPENAALNSNPYLSVERTPQGNFSFPVGRKTVEIVGSFGFCAIANVPDDVYRACFLGTLRLFKRDDTPLGVTGGSVGTQAVILPKLSADPDITELLAKYRRKR